MAPCQSACAAYIVANSQLGRWLQRQRQSPHHEVQLQALALKFTRVERLLGGGQGVKLLAGSIELLPRFVPLGSQTGGELRRPTVHFLLVELASERVRR